MWWPKSTREFWVVFRYSPIQKLLQRCPQCSSRSKWAHLALRVPRTAAYPPSVGTREGGAEPTRVANLCSEKCCVCTRRQKERSPHGQLRHYLRGHKNR